MAPTKRSIKALLSRNQLQTLRNGGRTSTGQDNPVVALGAGFIPIIQEGLNARLEPQGPYGPLTPTGIGHQYGAGGRMQLRGGYFDSSGNPHAETKTIGRGATDAWFLNLNTTRLTQDDLQHQAITNVRRLYSRLGRESEFNSDEMADAILEAQNFAIQNGQDNIYGNMPPHGTETLDLNRLAENQALEHNYVWRNLSSVINLIPDDESNSTQYPNVKGMLARVFLQQSNLERAIFFTGGDKGVDGSGQVLAKERTTLAALYAEYNYHAAQYTNSLLSFLNERMRAGINRMDPNFAITQSAGADVPISKESVMPEEQAAGIVGAATPQAPPIGNTGSMDYAINFMGQIHTGDVSNMGIYDEYQHGLSRGSIATRSEISKMLKQQGNDPSKQGKGTIHQKIYDYYKKEAMPDWNSALSEIKRTAAQTYNIAQKTLSPEQMRNPFGASSNPSYGVSRRGSPKSVGQGVTNQSLSNLSTSLNGMMRNIPALALQQNTTKGTETAVEFVNHMMGTWHQHLGNAFHSLTVKEKPRITSTAFLQQYTEGRNMYLFNIPAFTKNHLAVQDGYALINMLRNAGYITHSQIDDTIFKMKSAELARKVKGSNTTVTIGRNNAIGTTGIINSNKARATLSINIPADYEQKIIDNVLTAIEPPRIIGEYRIPPRERRILNTVGHAMGQQSQFNRQLWITQQRYMRDGRFWPHLATMWAAPYMTRLRRS